MSTLTGGRVWDTYYDRWTTWRPIGPVVDEYLWLTHSGSDAYVCLGVVGDRRHWNTAYGEDHTSRASGWTIDNAGNTVRPLKGWVYAFDARVPEMDKFERWLLEQLRSGPYTHLIKYFNINGRHWNRKSVVNGIKFAKASTSSDHHFHCSFMPGAEYAHSSILSDYETFRRTGKTPDTGMPPTPAPFWIAGVLAKLPELRKGAEGLGVKILQALECAHGFATSIDGVFGPDTDRQLRRYQAIRKVHNSVVNGLGDGICGEHTWKSLVGQRLPQVIFGSRGLAVRQLQALECAHGFRTDIDGIAGTDTITQLKGFQVHHRVHNSVVNGRGDGICGQHSWTALLNHQLTA